jgi:hypothetical protein
LSCGERTLAGSILNPRACAYSTKAWLKRGSSGSAPSTTAERLSGISAEHAAEEHPRRLAASDHRLGRLTVREPHEAVPADTRREDQRVHDPVPARHRVEHEAHATEIDLQLVARRAVGHPHRLSPPPPTAKGLGDVALHRPARHLHPAPLQQLRDLHAGQIALNPSP